MKSKFITLATVAAILGGIVLVNQYEPRRMAEAQYDAERKANEGIVAAEEAEKAKVRAATTKAITDKFKQIGEDGRKIYLANKEAAVIEKAEEEKYLAENKDYLVTFDCSNGEIVLEVSVELAPLGAVQFRKAVEDGVYDGARFFRVIPGFMVQFGIPGDPKKAAKWKNAKIKDDPVKAGNTRGTMTFATSGPDSRTTQVFINYGDNSRLDNMGFTPFAKVVKGMDVVDSIFSGHRERPDQEAIQRRGNAYLESNFPELDYIKKATIQEIPVAAAEEEEGESDDA